MALIIDNLLITVVEPIIKVTAILLLWLEVGSYFPSACAKQYSLIVFFKFI